MKNREIRIEDDLAFIPLGPAGKHGEAKLYHADYNYLLSRGISGNWTLSNGYVVVTVPPKYVEEGRKDDPQHGAVNPFSLTKPRQEYVARLLLNAADQEIRYADNDRTNLIRENLSSHPREFGTQNAAKKFPYIEGPAAFSAGISMLAQHSTKRTGLSFLGKKGHGPDK